MGAHLPEEPDDSGIVPSVHEQYDDASLDYLKKVRAELTRIIDAKESEILGKKAGFK